MIHYSTKHEVKKTFKKIIWQQIGGWKMEMDASMRSFQNMGKILILEAYTISFIHTSQFLGCSSKSKYSTWIRYTILQYTTRFSNQLCKIPMWLPFRINNISPEKSDSQFQMLDLKIEVTPEKPKLSEFWKSTDYSQFSGVQK